MLNDTWNNSNSIQICENIARNKNCQNDAYFCAFLTTKNFSQWNSTFLLWWHFNSFRARHNSLLALIPLSKDANQLSVDDPVISLWQTSSIWRPRENRITIEWFSDPVMHCSDIELRIPFENCIGKPRIFFNIKRSFDSRNMYLLFVIDFKKIFISNIFTRFT